MILLWVAISIILWEVIKGIIRAPRNCIHCGKHPDESVRYERDGYRRDGHHVMIGMPSPLNPDWKPKWKPKCSPIVGTQVVSEPGAAVKIIKLHLSDEAKAGLSCGVAIPPLKTEE